MRAVLAVFLLAGCATVTATVKPAPSEPVPAAAPAPVVCPTAPGPFSDAEPQFGARVEKVCLVGASEDSYLRLHELVAPREGVPLDAAAVRADIEALFEQGLVRDVVVVAQPLPAQAVVLSYFVTEYEWISKVNFPGAKAVKADELGQVAHAGLRASPVVLKALSAQVKALYAGLGYPQTTAVGVLESLGGGNAQLTLQVEEGPRVTVGAITFAGAKHVGEPELRKALKTEPGAAYLDDLVERDAFALTAVYYDHGHVNVRVVPSSRPLSAPVGAVELVFTVTEGDVFHLGKLALTGFSLGAEKDLLKLMESKPKSVFSRTVLQRDIERLRDRAKVQGYVVEVTPLTTVDSEKKIIDVTFELEKKPGGRIQF